MRPGTHPLLLLVPAVAMACSAEGSTNDQTGAANEPPATGGAGGIPLARAGGAPGAVAAGSAGATPGVGGMNQSAGGEASGGAPGAGGDPAGTGGSTADPPPIGPTEPPQYDPTVGFDWPETTLQAGACEPGTYEGSFSCDMDFEGQVLTFEGPVSFTLEPSEDGEFLEIEDGQLTGFETLTLTPLEADLEGRLDCSTNAFEATLVNAQYTFPLFLFPLPMSGDMSATLDRTASTLQGEWFLVDASIPEWNCTGPWTAVKQQ